MMQMMREMLTCNHVRKKNTDENVFLATYLAMRTICSGIQHHNQTCTELLDVEKSQRFGHTANLLLLVKTITWLQ